MAITEPTLDDIGGQGRTVMHPLRRVGRSKGVKRLRRVKPKGPPPGGGYAGSVARRYPGIKRLKNKKRPVSEAETNANTASYHTSSVNAPLGYQGLFAGG